jgi:hypothetical protein
MSLKTIVDDVKAKWFYYTNGNKVLFHDIWKRSPNNHQIEQSFRVVFRLGNREDQKFFSIGCHLFNRFNFLSEAIRWGYRGDYWNLADDGIERVEFYKYMTIEEFEKIVKWVSELPPIVKELPRIQHQKQLTLFFKTE